MFHSTMVTRSWCVQQEFKAGFISVTYFPPSTYSTLSLQANLTNQAEFQYESLYSNFHVIFLDARPAAFHFWGGSGVATGMLHASTPPPAQVFFACFIHLHAPFFLPPPDQQKRGKIDRLLLRPSNAHIHELRHDRGLVQV